jgi:diguanylate cyclase (GGDEF)-like protein
MALLTSIIQERFRKNFLVIFLLSSTIPLLIMIFIIYKHVVPVLMPTQIADLHALFSCGVLVMLVPPFLSYVLGTRWVRLVEELSENVKSKSINIIGERQEFTTKNEFVIIDQGFNDLHDELQNKMSQLNEVSKKLIDSNIRLKEMATTDELTSLYNRRYFDQRLLEETSRSDRYKQELSLIMIDFDDFKQHNDVYGHQTGDKLLREMAKLIRTSLRKSDVVFRYGGDEFAVLILGCELTKAKHVAKGLVKRVSNHPFENLDGKPIERITISCGVACYKGNMAAFVAEADKHLFAAKSAGRGQVVAQM